MCLRMDLPQDGRVSEWLCLRMDMSQEGCVSEWMCLKKDMSQDKDASGWMCIRRYLSKDRNVSRWMCLVRLDLIHKRWTQGCTFNIYLFFIIFKQVLFQYNTTRRSGRYAPILLAPAEGWGPIGALLGAFGPLFSSRRCKRGHTQFSVKIGPHRSKQVPRGQNKKGPKMVPKQSP